MEDNQTTSGLSRRQVLKCAAGSGIALLLPMMAEAAAAAHAWTSAGPAKQFPLNQPTRVTLAGNVLYITRTGPKAFRALSSVCTHRGCEVAWTPASNDFVCPCHGSVFAEDGHSVQGTRRNPTEKMPPLASFPVRLAKGDVQVDLQALLPGPAAPAGGAHVGPPQ